MWRVFNTSDSRLSSMPLPSTTKALVLRASSLTTKDNIYHDARLESLPIPALKAGQVLVRVHAVSFNRRDLWIRRNLYPGIAMGSVLGSDFAGTMSRRTAFSADK